MQYLKPAQLKPLLKAEEVKPDQQVQQSDSTPEEITGLSPYAQWWEPNFRLAGERDRAFQQELEDRADRLNAGLWPYSASKDHPRLA